MNVNSQNTQGTMPEEDGNMPAAGVQGDGAAGQNAPGGGTTGQGMPSVKNEQEQGASNGGDTQPAADTAANDTAADDATESAAVPETGIADENSGGDSQNAPETGTEGDTVTGEGDVRDRIQGNFGPEISDALNYSYGTLPGTDSATSGFYGAITLAVCFALMLIAVFFAAIYKRR